MWKDYYEDQYMEFFELKFRDFIWFVFEQVVFFNFFVFLNQFGNSLLFIIMYLIYRMFGII